jgi:hypothetical protein
MNRLLTILFYALTFASFGQSSPLNVGFEGGFGLASLRGNDFIDKNHSSKTGYSAGLFVQYNFNKILSLRSGTYLEQKGSSFDFWAEDQNGQQIGPIQGKMNISYLNVPVLLRASFGKKTTYFVNAGPYIAFLLKQNEHTEAFSNYPETNADRTGDFTKVDAGLSAGLGISFDIKSKYALSLEIRDNLGMTNISKPTITNNGTIKTNTLNALVGFVYKL